MRFGNIITLDALALGARIRQAREKQGLSQEEFADLISRDQRAVSELEHGKRRLAATELPIFAQALDVPLLYFYEGEITLQDMDTVVLKEFHRLPTSEAREYAIELLRVFSEAMQPR